jgi:predicted RND superfamily exporter protein
MDVVIEPFWILLSFVYFFLAATHYKLSDYIIPSTFKAAAHPPAPDNTQMIFREIINNLLRNKKYLRLASAGFFVGGVVSLAQGISNVVDSGISINVVFVVLAAIIILLVIYWRWKWVILVFVGPIQRYRFKRKHNL